MPIAALLSLLGPVLVKVVSSILDRIFSHSVTTLQGSAAGAAAMTLVSQMCPNISLSQNAIVGAVAALPGLLGTDAHVTAPAILKAANDAVTAAKDAKREQPTNF